jgi:hypothetical protein
VPTEEEIEKIIKLYGNGLSQGQIAKEMGKGKSTINRWLQGLGLLNGTDSERSGTKKATEAKKTFDRTRRLALNDAFFDRICDMLKDVDKPSGLRDLAVSYGIIEDKRALLDPVSNVERGVAAIDAYIEEMKREASQDESQTAG